MTANNTYKLKSSIYSSGKDALIETQIDLMRFCVRLRPLHICSQSHGVLLNNNKPKERCIIFVLFYNSITCNIYNFDEPRSHSIYWIGKCVCVLLLLLSLSLSLIQSLISSFFFLVYFPDFYLSVFRQPDEIEYVNRLCHTHPAANKHG